MGYEMGFVKNNEQTTYSEDNYYWTCCGWEYTELHDEIAVICGNAQLGKFGDEYIIPVENLAFINEIWDKLQNCDFYHKYVKVVDIDPYLADEFLEKADIKDRVNFALAFSLSEKNIKYQPIATILYRSTSDGYFTVECFKKGYDRMIADNAKNVILYGG